MVHKQPVHAPLVGVEVVHALPVAVVQVELVVGHLAALGVPLGGALVVVPAHAQGGGSAGQAASTINTTPAGAGPRQGMACSDTAAHRCGCGQPRGALALACARTHAHTWG
jgi:hypothetical protein